MHVSRILFCRKNGQKTAQKRENGEKCAQKGGKIVEKRYLNFKKIEKTPKMAETR
jgi:hypothetical protein